MRAHEFIFEAQDYEASFRKMIEIADSINNDLIKKEVGDHIRWAKSTLKRQDRIVWYLRIFKFVLLRYLLSELISYNESTTDQEEKTRVSALIGQISKKDLPELSKKTRSESELSPINYTRVKITHDTVKTDLEHFISLDAIIPEAKNTVWGNQSYQELSDHFEKLEADWREKNRGLVEIQDGDKELLKVTSDQSWWILDREYCRKEGASMGHCGNTAAWAPGDRILSYRTRVTNTMLKPHLTFILHSNGFLGEMKGRGNEKPHERYHPAIVALLRKTNLIKGITGGGYRPENNFNLYDLGDEDLIQELLAMNPNLVTFSEMIENLGIQDRNVRLRALDEFDRARITRESESTVITPDQVDAKYIIETYSDISDVIRYHGNDKLKWAANVLNGNDRFEFWDVPVSNDQIEDLFDSYLKKHPSDLEKIKNYLIENHEYNEEEDGDWFEFVTENDIDDLIDPARSAVITGMESGAESEMYDDFISAIKESGLRYEGHPMDASFDYVVTLDELLYSYRDTEDISSTVEELRDFKVELEEPRYGWDGYDEDAAIEQLGNGLSDILE